jgi:hypothetical protein
MPSPSKPEAQAETYPRIIAEWGSYRAVAVIDENVNVVIERRHTDHMDAVCWVKVEDEVLLAPFADLLERIESGELLITEAGAVL